MQKNLYPTTVMLAVPCSLLLYLRIELRCPSTDGFSSSAVCLAPPQTMNALKQERSFLVNTNLISSCPVIEVYAVFSNRVLESILVVNGEQWQ